MLKEIRPEELIPKIGGDVYVFKNGRIEPLEEFLEDVRILVDCDIAKTTEPKKEKKETSGAKSPAEHAKRIRRKSADLEEEILKAWNRGERTIAEIQKITGASYATIRKYIPATPNG